MPTRIDKLTPEQIARMPEWVDRWVKIGLSTEPANFDAAERGVRGCYVAAGLTEPRVVLRLGSPFAAVLGGCLGAILLRSQVWSQVGSQVGSQVQSQVESQVRSQVWSQVWSQVGSQVWSQVRSQVESQVESQVGSQVESQVESQVRSQVGSQVQSQVESQVWSQVESQVGSQVWSQVQSQVWSQVESQVWSQVGSQVESQVWSQVRSQVRSQVGSALYQYRCGNLWASWYSLVSFLREICGWQASGLTTYAHDELHARSASWCWYHDQIAAIADRPASIRLDDRGRLHADDGMAIAYRDGWGLWQLHGVSVDEQTVMRPESQTAEQIRQEQNEEAKRLRIERFAGRDAHADQGWRRYLSAVGAKKVDERKNDIENTREALFASPDGMTVLVCACPSTARRYALEVPPEIKSAEQAQNWLWQGGRLSELTGAGRCIGRS